MTGDILEWDAIVELREPYGSSSGTYNSYLFWIFGIYKRILKQMVFIPVGETVV